LGGYVEGLAMLRLNLRDALALARQVEAQRSDAALCACGLLHHQRQRSLKPALINPLFNPE